MTHLLSYVPAVLSGLMVGVGVFAGGYFLAGASLWWGVAGAVLLGVGGVMTARMLENPPPT